MNIKLHRNVLLVQMRLSIMLNSSIHAIVRRLLKTWNRRARGLLNLGEGRARGIRRQNESEWIPVPWNALEILQSYTNPSKWVCQFTCRSCVWSLLCLIGSLFGLTSNLCNATPLCGESTGQRSRLRRPISKIRMILLMDAKTSMISLIIMFAVHPICVQDSIFKMSSESSDRWLVDSA